MNKLEAFKKIIREEVREAVREELKLILAETTSTKPQKVTKQAPKPQLAERTITTTDPIQRLLAETAFSMNTEDYRTMVNAGADMAQNFPQMAQSFMPQPSFEPKVVNTVTDMIANTRPVHDINQVQIDVVPDFTGLMKTMKNSGQI